MSGYTPKKRASSTSTGYMDTFGQTSQMLGMADKVGVPGLSMATKAMPWVQAGVGLAKAGTRLYGGIQEGRALRHQAKRLKRDIRTGDPIIQERTNRQLRRLSSERKRTDLRTLGKLGTSQASQAAFLSGRLGVGFSQAEADISGRGQAEQSAYRRGARSELGGVEEDRRRLGGRVAMGMAEDLGGAALGFVGAKAAGSQELTRQEAMARQENVQRLGTIANVTGDIMAEEGRVLGAEAKLTAADLDYDRRKEDARTKRAGDLRLAGFEYAGKAKESALDRTSRERIAGMRAGAGGAGSEPGTPGYPGKSFTGAISHYKEIEGFQGQGGKGNTLDEIAHYYSSRDANQMERVKRAMEHWSDPNNPLDFRSAEQHIIEFEPQMERGIRAEFNPETGKTSYPDMEGYEAIKAAFGDRTDLFTKPAQEAMLRIDAELGYELPENQREYPENVAAGKAAREKVGQGIGKIKRNVLGVQYFDPMTGKVITLGEDIEQSRRLRGRIKAGAGAFFTGE